MTKENRYPSSWGRLRPIAYTMCVDRDGELCQHCHKHPVKPGQAISDPLSQCHRLDVDHVDNNSAHNPEDGKNWQLLCHKCNCLKIASRTPRRNRASVRISKLAKINDMELKRERVSERERAGRWEHGSESRIVQSREMAKSEASERWLRSYLPEMLKMHGKLNKKAFIDAACEEFYRRTGHTISQQALARMLDKMCNHFNGDFETTTEDHIAYIRKRN